MGTNSRIVIGLTGYAQSGKDTIGTILVNDHGFTRLSFADNVREAAWRLNPLVPDPYTDPDPDMAYGVAAYPLQEIVKSLGWEAAKAIPEVRRLLQVMGTEVGREMFGETAWVDMVARQIEGLSKIVITDVRFKNEADFVRSLGGTVVMVKRAGNHPINQHASEQLDFEVDMTLHNNDTIPNLRAMVNGVNSLMWSS